MADIEFVEHASAEVIADWIEGFLQSALDAADGQIAITVPGGSTPFPIFEVLKTRPIDWPRIDVWPGDDRLVAEDHPASNTGKIRAMLEPVGANIITLEEAGAPPHFALAWMGMGGDGHIASLFPNTDPQVDATDPVIRLTPDPLPVEAPFDRVTLTIPSLLNSEAVMFVIRGDEKREVFEEAARGGHDLPIARFLTAATQKIICFT